MGQNFLINRSIAEAEAAHAVGKTVLEIGPGRGILTEELCRVAKKVIAVEKDSRLYDLLSANLHYDNLQLINADFIDEKDSLPKVDIVISNIPYSLSSSVIEWLSERRVKAVLCLQKEFVEHMMARPDTRNYSMLSVASHLSFRVVKIMNVAAGSFRPIPMVGSVIVYLEPKEHAVSERERKILGLLMQHKKKTLRNALLDSEKQLGIEHGRLLKIAETLGIKERPFKMQPEELLEVSARIVKMLE